MFKTITLLAAFICMSGYAVADDDQCQKDFGYNVSQCAQAFQELAPKERAQEQKFCVVQVKEIKEACLTGPDPVCVADCEAAYSSTESSCDATRDSHLVFCESSITCQINVNNTHSTCISDAVDTLNVCTAGC